MLEWYVIANGELFREGLNALVTFLGQSTFDSLIRTSMAFGVYALFCVVIKSRDWWEILKWYGMVILVTGIIISPKTDVAVYDSSNPGAVLEVDNVPTVLAWIGSVLTTVGYGVTTAMETAFHLPDELSYTKTGMLFGAKMFQASHSFQILTPTLHSAMDDYIQNCVIGDMKINKKYTPDELHSSQALWDLWSQNPSPVRRIVWDGEFITCADATPKLKTAMQKEITDESFVLYGKKIFGASGSNYEALFNQYLSPSYGYFINASQTATDIFMQTMLINAMNEGVRDYAAMSGSSAGLQNYINTKTMLQTQATWQAFGEEADYFLPLMQTILLLLFTCIFPFVCALSLLPRGFAHWTAYLRYFLWIELWPPLFAIVNMAMNFYLQQRSSAFSGSNVSMDTFSQLAQLHQSSTAIAGYVSIMVPVIARGLVSNTVLEAIAGIASGLLGGLQSTASQASNEATSGNFSMGNTSYHNASANNFNANKHDTDWTDFHGTITEQMASGVMKTTTENGQTVYNVSQGLSNLAQSVNLSEQLSSTLSHSAEAARASAVTESNNVQSSVSSAASHFVQLGEALSNDHRDNDHASLGLSDTVTKAYSTIDSLTDEISKNEHVSKSEAFKELGNMVYQGQVNVDAKNGALGMVAKYAIGAGGQLSASYSNSDASEHTDNYSRNDHHGLTSRQLDEASHAFNTIESHQNSLSSDVSDSRAKTLVENFASDLHSAHTASHNRDVSYSQSERLSTMATQAKTNSASVNNNMNQAFVNYVREVEGDAKADALFSNPGVLSSQAQLSTLGSRFANQVAHDMLKDNVSGFESNIHPEANFTQQSMEQGEGGVQSVLTENQQSNRDILRHKSEFQTTNGVEHEIRDNVNAHIAQAQNNTTNAINEHWQTHQADKKAMEETLDAGHVDATQYAPFKAKYYTSGSQRKTPDKIE